MKLILIRYWATILSGLIGIAVFIFGPQFNFSGLLVRVFQELDKFMMGELVFAIEVVMIGIFIDLYRYKQYVERELEKEKIRLETLKETMRTVQDIVGNCLNGLQLFRIHAEQTKALPMEELQTYDTIVENTRRLLSKLSNLESTPTREIYKGVPRLISGMSKLTSDANRSFCFSRAGFAVC